MDTQNVVESTSTKPPASALKQAGPEPGNNNSKPLPSRKSPTVVRSSPPVKEQKSQAQDDDGGADANSEAETIVLAKDGSSPSKPRKGIKHEATKSDGDDSAPIAKKQSAPARDGKDAKSGRDGRDVKDGKDGRDGADRPHKAAAGRDVAASLDAISIKKKHLQTNVEKQRGKGECSSGLSSAPASPPPPPQQQQQQQQASSTTQQTTAHRDSGGQPPVRRRRLSAARSASESESVRAHSPKPSTASKEKPRSTADKVVPHKRKAPKIESEDEANGHKVRRQRTNSIAAGGESSQAASRDHGSSNHGHGQAHNSNKSSATSTAVTKPHHDPHHSNAPSGASARNRSFSPPPRAHRRSISTQLPTQSSNGLSHKKKRVPAPLQSTEYHSDESSASGSPRIRSSKLRSLATPATTESNVSPAKMAPHKKHLDAHGQTFLARACARGEYDVAKQRLGERPEDLNVADFAGNTPLQIASINGYEDIVKLLIDAGCALDCVNYDKDTPLLDAVENGHVQVVKLLLEAGVNPRKANVNGVEPLDRITDTTDESNEIKRLLIEAKQRMGERRRTSEEHHHRPSDGRESHGPESPRHSPATASAPHSAAASRRGATGRATKTSNHLLYMPMDDKTLRQAAGRGDEETVTRILQVRDTFDDPESMVAAARGGHDMIINLLLALGNANPDPPPVESMSPEFATPMLAAIGQENIKVVELLLTQANFDPTRRFKGETYYEIARRRQGPNWKEEEHSLKIAYDAYKKAHKDIKTKSPAARDQEREAKRATVRLTDHTRDEASNTIRRKASSPPKEASREFKKGATSKAGPTNPKEKRRSNSFTAAHRDDKTSPKRGPGRPKKDDRLPTIALTSREASPSVSKQPTKTKRTEADPAAMSSEGEAAKPRRKLVSGRELKGEREKEKQRRASLVSTASSMKEPPSPRDPRDDASDKLKSEKFLDRTKQLRRDESRDRPSVSGESTGKRHRLSATPPHASSEKESGEAPVKRRRLDVDGKEKRQKPSSSPDSRPHKPAPSRDGPVKPRKDAKEHNEGKEHKGVKDKDPKDKDRDTNERKENPKPRKTDSPADGGRRESGKSAGSEKSIHVKSEDPDVEMRDVDQVTDDPEAQTLKVKEEEKRRQAEAAAAAAAAALSKQEEEGEEERKKVEEEKRKQEEEREKKRREEEERRLREEEEAEKRRVAEEERKRVADEERKHQEEEERKRREQEEEVRKRREEEEEGKRKAAEEEARLRREEEERERKRKEEEELKRREEEERLRKEQLEREAAEHARRLREEEERREQERLREVERKRAAREAEQRRLMLEKLPPLLRWLEECPQPKTAYVAQKFSTIQGVRFDCIRPETTGTADGREQWLLNTQVALLLGEKDLELSRYTFLERVPVSRIAKIMIWRIEADRYALTTPNLYEFGSQLPDYYRGEDPERMGYKTIEQLRAETWTKFEGMDMFFVKVSELMMFIVPTVPHLHNLKLTVAYKELPEDGSLKWQSCQKWKGDPDANRFYGFAPGNKYYVNGALVHEQTPGLSAVSKTPFPEARVPRRGLAVVSPDDPEYVALCREQGLHHLVASSPRSPLTPRLPNGVASSSPAQAASSALAPAAHPANHSAPNGDLSPEQRAPATTPVVNSTGNAVRATNQASSPAAAANAAANAVATAVALAAAVAADATPNHRPIVNGIAHPTTPNGAGS